MRICTPALLTTPSKAFERVLQCVAVRCSALQCVAVRGSALQCIAVRCSALQDVLQSTTCSLDKAVNGLSERRLEDCVYTAFKNALQCFAVCCSVLQCFARALQYAAELMTCSIDKAFKGL